MTTLYVVYSTTDDKQLIYPEATVDAHSGEAAIRQVAKTDGYWVAIPARSITRRKVTTETTTRVRVEPA